MVTGVYDNIIGEVRLYYPAWKIVADSTPAPQHITLLLQIGKNDMTKITTKRVKQSKINKLMKRVALPKHLQHINKMAAGIDIGSKSHFVAVPEGCDIVSVREFQSFTADLHDLANWLEKCGVTTVAMESTGVYWVRHEVAMQTVAADSHLHATYCSVSSSLPGHAIGVI